MALGKGLNSLIPQMKGKTVHKETGKSKAGELWHIPLSDIIPNPEQPRKHFDHAELEDLVHSIKQHGVLQPISVSERMDGGYEIIAGERRFRASQIAGLATIPAIVRTVSEQDKLELSLVENIQRQELNPIEEAFAYQRLQNEFHLTQEQIGERVGKSRPAIANTIRLLALPEVIQKALMDGTLSAGKARPLLSLASEAEQMELFAQMMGGHVSARNIERAVSEKASRKGSTRRDPNTIAYEQKLEEKLGTKVRITQRGEKGMIAIEYYSKEELRRILSKLVI